MRLARLGLDGRGLGWLPRTWVDDDLQQARLVAAAGADWSVPPEIRLYRERAPIGRAAEAFWSAVDGERSSNAR